MSFQSIRKYALAASASFLTAGCVYTGSDFTAAPAGKLNIARQVKTPATILVVEGTINTNRSYCAIGEISAYARKVSVFAPTPTREDVNQELRTKAAEMGADAVIQVHYTAEGTIVPPSDLGEIEATGKALVFMAGNQQCPR